MRRLNFKLNVPNFYKLIGDIPYTELAKKLDVSRTHLHRISNNEYGVGIDFIEKFKEAYPDEKVNEYIIFEDEEVVNVIKILESMIVYE